MDNEYLKIDERRVADKVADEILEVDDEKDKRFFLLLILLLVGLIITLSSISFAVLTATNKGKDNVISTGSVLFSLDEGTSYVEIKNAYPTSDTVGMNLSKDNEHFDFKISVDFTNTMSNDITYEISLVPLANNTLDSKFVRVYLIENDKPVQINKGTVNNFADLPNSNIRNGGKLLLTKKLSSKTVNSYVFRMWLSDKYDNYDVAKTFRCSVCVDSY